MLESAAGNLGELVVDKDFEEIPVRTRIGLFTDLVRAARDMHEAGIVHRDITPQNVLVVGGCEARSGCHAVLCDFGNACSYGGSSPWPSQELSGFEAPEVFTAEGDRPARDMWSVGLVLLQLMDHGPEAERTFHEGALRSSIAKGEFTAKDPSVVAIMDAVGPMWAKILQRMLDPNVATRATAAEVLDMLEEEALSQGGTLKPARGPPSPLDGWSSGAPPRWQAFFRRLVLSPR